MYCEGVNLNAKMGIEQELQKLNNRQREAVTASTEPLLVLAGAGSGKTKVLALRIAWLITTGQVQAGNVLALTFTNKAAAEMSGRVRALLRQLGSAQKSAPLAGFSPAIGGSVEPVLSTFHSLGVKMLRLHGSLLSVPPQFSIIDSDDQQKILKEIFTTLEVPESILPAMALHYIHSIKNSGVSPEQRATEYRNFVGGFLLQTYYAYQKRLQSLGVVDLDDLVVLPTRLLEEFPAVRSFYQDLFQHVLVDEYQDTNPIQYRFLRALCPPSAISVVGDDAQSIYGFRGSDVTNILNFETDFRNAQVVVLDQNYRSTAHVLAVAGAVLQHSKEQKPKELWTNREGGRRVVVQELASEQEEAAFIVNAIVEKSNPEGVEFTVPEDTEAEEWAEKPFSVLDYLLASRTKGPRSHPATAHLHALHGPLGRYAVLYRTHAQSRVLESACIAAGIPYRIVGGLRFFDRKEIKDALAFLRVIMNPTNLLAWERAAGAVKRGVGDKALEMLRGIIQQARETHESNAHTAEGLFTCAAIYEAARQQLGDKQSKLLQFIQLFQKLDALDSKASLTEFIQAMFAQSGLLAQYATGDPALVDKYDNLRELESLAGKYTSFEWRQSLSLFLEEAALMSEADAVGASDDAITLMTLHAAKGLEFDVVFFAGLEEGLLPHARSLQDEKALAEEVRLAYVGITRAKEELYITLARQRGLYGETKVGVPSRFLRGLPETAIHWRGSRPRFLPESDGGADGSVSYVSYEDY